MQSRIEAVSNDDLTRGEILIITQRNEPTRQPWLPEKTSPQPAGPEALFSTRPPQSSMAATQISHENLIIIR